MCSGEHHPRVDERAVAEGLDGVGGVAQRCHVTEPASGRSGWWDRAKPLCKSDAGGTCAACVLPQRCAVGGGGSSGSRVKWYQHALQLSRLGHMTPATHVAPRRTHSHLPLGAATPLTIAGASGVPAVAAATRPSRRAAHRAALMRRPATAASAATTRG